MGDTAAVLVNNEESALKSDNVILSGRLRNAEVDWDAFDPVPYNAHNYQSMRADDCQIVAKVRDFFAGAAITAGATGLDVGPGANLYPALGMLPFTRHIDLLEFSAANVAWLEAEVKHFDTNWDRFWAVYAQHPAYAAVADPRVALAERATVRQQSVFELPRSRWDVGTMFFVACSISTEPAEFRRALACFVAALRPGAPFAAAFMVNSSGYHVGDVPFPAVAIDAAEVEKCLASIAYDVHVEEIDTDDPLRDGCGMALATGRANRLI